jgi:hypothetical protein
MAHNYAEYSFGYTVYAKAEGGELPEHLLRKGFLPYTGGQIEEEDLYYLARSLRIGLQPFPLSSENRRTLRKFEDFNIEEKIYSKADYLWTAEINAFCLDYAQERFSSPLSKERLQSIREHAHLSHYLEFRRDGQLMALIFLSCSEKAWHYWFAFLDLKIERPLGKWAMTRTAQIASDQDVEFLYVGTCYGTHSLYKVRDFGTTSFFEGTQWLTDKKLLKNWCKTDTNVSLSDRLKRDTS